MALACLLSSCSKDRAAWKPEPVFTIKPDSGLTTQVFDFRLDIPNMPNGQQEFYVRWDMDGDSAWDAAFSAMPSISYRFYRKGTHSIKAEILTEDGQRILLNKAVKVEQGYSAPHASFMVTPPEGNFLTDFVLDAGATSDDEEPTSSLLYKWDFDDDGRWDTSPGSDPRISHRYPKPGRYTVRLAVTDPTQRMASVVKQIVVDMHDDGILPGFTWSPADATVKDTFLLDASASRRETDSSCVFNYTWSVKDEVVYGPFADPKFRHQFWSYGLKEVTLTVTDGLGLSNSLTKEIYVVKENKPPSPAILVATHYGNITSQFYLSSWPSTDDVTPPSKLLVRWDFEGDGTWDTGWSYDKVVTHQFAVPGDYQVTLQAQDEGGERATGTTRIQVSGYTNETGWIRDPRDGKYYGTVKIGSQWWMSDNLDYRSNPKMHIPMLQQCPYEAAELCDRYGALYQTDRFDGYNRAGGNICPDGWRVPTSDDWKRLASQLPLSKQRDALLVGGSSGFNARMLGYASFYFKRKLDYPYDITDTVYVFREIGHDVRYLSQTRRPFLNPMQECFYAGLLDNYEGFDLLWGSTDDYYFARCVKDE